MAVLGGLWLWVCVCGGVVMCVSKWMSEFWTSDIPFMLILTISMSIVCLVTKSGLSFGKLLFICAVGNTFLARPNLITLRDSR